MPGGPDYPLDASARFNKVDFEAIRPPRAADDIQGIFRTPEGDIRTWLIASEAADAVRKGHLALAYLDVADRLSDTRHVELLARLTSLDATVAAAAADISGLKASVDQIKGMLGVEVPAWINMEEVREGDDMGLVRPSAAALGLVVTVNVHQREAGFDHEQIISSSPSPGTLVARGSTVVLEVNFQG